MKVSTLAVAHLASGVPFMLGVAGVSASMLPHHYQFIHQHLTSTLYHFCLQIQAVHENAAVAAETLPLKDPLNRKLRPLSSKGDLIAAVPHKALADTEDGLMGINTVRKLQDIDITLTGSTTFSKIGNRRSSAWDTCPGSLDSAFMTGDATTVVNFNRARLIPTNEPNKYKLEAKAEDAQVLKLGQGGDTLTGTTCFDHSYRGGFSIDLRGTGYSFAEGSTVTLTGWSASMRLRVDGIEVLSRNVWAGGTNIVHPLSAGGQFLQANCGGWGGNCQSEIFVLVPTGAPTSSPTPNPWQISFIEMRPNFGANSVEELELDYQVGRGRDVVHALYAGNCNPNTNPVAINGLQYNVTNTTGTPSNGMEPLTLSYSFDKSSITGSNIWNKNETKIELCQVVQLTAEGRNGRMVITEDLRNITVDFDMGVNFSIDGNVNLTGADINNEQQNTSLSEYVTAFKCNGLGTPKNTDPLAPNTELNVCIESASSSVQIDKIVNMVSGA